MLTYLEDFRLGALQQHVTNFKKRAYCIQVRRPGGGGGGGGSHMRLL